MKKKCLLFTIIALFIAQFSIAQTAKPAPKATATTKTNETVVYRIKLGAFKNPDLKKFESLKPAKNGVIATEDAGNGLTRILIGDFAAEADANTALETIQKAGYAEAFVTKRKVNAATTTDTKNSTDTKNAPSSPTDDDSKYMIQLAVMPDPSYEDYSNLVDIGQMYSERIDKNFRLSIGTFVGKDAANKALAKIKKRGYEQAYLRPITAKNADKATPKNEEKNKETKK